MGFDGLERATHTLSRVGQVLSTHDGGDPEQIRDVRVSETLEFVQEEDLLLDLRQGPQGRA